MRSFSYYILVALPAIFSAQLIQLNSGTNSNLLDLSIIGENIVISGTNHYLVKSYDQCTHLSPISIPGPSGYFNRLVRLDTSNAFMLSYSSGQTLIYKTIDGGYNWSEKIDTAGAITHQMDFFDGTEGILSDGKKIMRSQDEGDNWSLCYNSSLLSISAIITNRDSVVCAGGFGLGGCGFHLSKDRGHTWPYYWGSLGNTTVIDFFFLNKDTLFGITQNGGFTKTIDGGNNWIDYSGNEPTVPIANSILFKNYKEGYMVGATSQSVGLIAKTTDLGKTWYTYNTGINSVLLNMAFLNDSIAIITGANGTLLRWNYKNTVFTGIEDQTLAENGFKIFPNPIADKLTIENKNKTISTIEVSNSLGQTILSLRSGKERDELDFSDLPGGMYFLRIEDHKGNFTKKLIKN